MDKKKMMNMMHEFHQYVAPDVVDMAVTLETCIFQKEELQKACSIEIGDDFDELDRLRAIYDATADDFTMWECATHREVLRMNHRMGRKHPDIDQLFKKDPTWRWTTRILIHCIEEGLVDCADPEKEIEFLRGSRIAINSRYGMLIRDIH